jgi:hypothetical protein
MMMPTTICANDMLSPPNAREEKQTMDFLGYAEQTGRYAFDQLWFMSWFVTTVACMEHDTTTAKDLGSS